ncbi:MAG: hypothetical protein R3B54_13490 [Bdellovibrionota bacterium]
MRPQLRLFIAFLVLAALARWQQEKRTHGLLCGELADFQASGRSVRVVGELGLSALGGA